MIVRGIDIEIIRGQCGSARAAFPVKAAASGSELEMRVFYRSALRTILRRKIALVKFEVSDKAAGGPLKANAKILAQEIFRLIYQEKTGLKKIIVCAPDQRVYAAFKLHCLGYLDYIANKLQSPFVTVDAIIKMKGGIVVIKRRNPPLGWALPGGFVDYGESLEQAVIREAKEETGLEIKNLRQFHTYSDPTRDPRFHTIGTVFICRAKGRPRAGDDAAEAKIVSLAEIKLLDFAFDHRLILQEYFQKPVSFRGVVFPHRLRRG